MLKDPDFEQDYWSRTAEGIYKIRHDSIRILKWLFYYDRSYYDNVKYFVFFWVLFVCAIVQGYKLHNHSYKFKYTQV